MNQIVMKAKATAKAMNHDGRMDAGYAGRVLGDLR